MIVKKIDILNRANNTIHHKSYYKYNVVQINYETESTLLQRVIIDKDANTEQIEGTIDVLNWTIINYDVGSLNYYLNKRFEDKRIDPDGKIEKFLDEEFSNDFDNL